MSTESGDAAQAVKAARIEVSRCAAHVSKGGSVTFWIHRLDAAATAWERAAAILREQIAKLTEGA